MQRSGTRSHDCFAPLKTATARRRYLNLMRIVWVSRPNKDSFLGFV